jgi:hypothetical protein
MVTTRAASTKDTHPSAKKAAHSAIPRRPVTPAEKSKKPPCTDQAQIKSQDQDPKIKAQAKSDTLKKMSDLLTRLSSDSSTICPSQIARGLNKDNPARYPDWRAIMEFTRTVVWEEVRKGTVQVTQGGEVRDFEDRNSLKGPIRVRRGPGWTSSGG